MSELTSTLKPKSSIFLIPFDLLGRFALDRWGATKSFFHYALDIIIALVTPPFRIKETIQQIYSIGVLSAPIILFCVSFAAAVTIMEYAYHMKLVIQSATMVPGFAALLVLRELGAMITALLLTSRVGAGITAEVGTMQITEQIDALRLLNVEPVRYLVIPRFIASILSSAALVVFANATCIFFLMVMSVRHLNYSPETFLSAMNHFSTFKDFGLSIAKASVFGAVIPLVSCFYGFNCKAGAEGVGNATTQAVVTNAILIIFLDFVLTYFFSFLY